MKIVDKLYTHTHTHTHIHIHGYILLNLLRHLEIFRYEDSRQSIHPHPHTHTLVYIYYSHYVLGMRTVDKQF